MAKTAEQSANAALKELMKQKAKKIPSLSVILDAKVGSSWKGSHLDGNTWELKKEGEASFRIFG